jgi:hypothetical protein
MNENPDSSVPPPSESLALSMEKLFRRDERGRGAYLSRLFAFFSEEVVRHWAACEQAPYRDIGRPVVWDEESPRYHVLDFTLERRTDGLRFVSEMKCEIEFEGFRYLTLKGPEEIAHHVSGAAFQKFIRLARHPGDLRVTVGGAEQEIVGAILVWGVVTTAGRRAAMDHYGLAEVLSVEEMLRDLAEWQPAAWAEWIGTRRRWSDELFDWLAYRAAASTDPS